VILRAGGRRRRERLDCLADKVEPVRIPLGQQYRASAQMQVDAVWPLRERQCGQCPADLREIHGRHIHSGRMQHVDASGPGKFGVQRLQHAGRLEQLLQPVRTIGAVPDDLRAEPFGLT
jgi:hypothetical protein